MINFFHKLFNPHCEHCIADAREAKHCNTCDILRMELARTQAENRILLDRILEKPSLVIDKAPSPELMPIMPKQHLSFTAKRQMLEENDRQSAKLKRDNESKTNVDELEKELNVAEKARS